MIMIKNRRMLAPLLIGTALAASCCEGKNPDPAKVDPPVVETPDEAKVGSVLPAWKEGYLDIHFINGGRGESTYCIFPDGTTMLIDAAGAPKKNEMDPPGVAPKPSENISSGQVIVNYINHFMPAEAGGKIDYFLATHYHSDHIGAVTTKTYTIPMTVGLGFYDNGIGAVGTRIPLMKVIDRGDSKDRPSTDTYPSSTVYNNYLSFIDWSTKKYGTTREKMRVGYNDQIVMKKNAGDYPSFKVMNIAANGDVLTGSGNESSSEIPSTKELLANYLDNLPSGNILSCVIKISYGKFDYFTGGDIQYSGRSTYSWRDIEAPIARVTGRVEAMKACHHATSNTNSDALLSALKPDVVLGGVWRSVQPNAATIKRMYTANSRMDIFLTAIGDDAKSELTSYMSKFGSIEGHYVIRVNKDGQYKVYTLDDTNEKYLVKKISGPYKSE
jgi:beta-lactamase superfamily II metal-dependent hydrolase